MKRPLTEQQVLKELDIPSFRYITKDKVIKLASMIPNMDREVAIKALEQFPNFSATTKSIVSEIRSTIDKMADHNANSTQTYYDLTDRIMNALEISLSDGSITFEERKWILEKMLELNDKVYRKDTENKSFLALGQKVVGVLGIAALFGLGVAVGSNLEVNSRQDDDYDPYSNNDDNYQA